ncbi:uncharacterized protein LOC135465838 [Liolophura sinensis]|uniref:uncharacterized protein LOC135465838 n=1 Tax=Liolophura sinensis TaxID=3198878 RepID=UPI00315973B6
MGNTESGLTRIFEGTQPIECSPRVEESDFQRIIQSGVTEKDRRVLRGGMTLLGEHPSWVWKNAVVRCIGDDIDFSFYCGGCTNRFVVCFDGHDEVRKQCNNTSWALYLYNGALHIWGNLKQLASLGAPAALKAIMRP